MIKSRCRASCPRERQEDGWSWCVRPRGHKGPHWSEDIDACWIDEEEITVYTFSKVRTVPDHEHTFSPEAEKWGDALCDAEPNCSMTWAQHRDEEGEGVGQ